MIKMMINPNNCDMCDHKKKPDGGWCYMFKDEPTKVCMQHTARNNEVIDQDIWNDKMRQV